MVAEKAFQLLITLILGVTLVIWCWVMCQDTDFRRKIQHCFKPCGAPAPAPRRKFKVRYRLEHSRGLDLTFCAQRQMNFKANADDFVEIDWRRHRENTKGGLQESFLMPANHFKPAS